MPVIRKPKKLGQRVFFTKAGLIKNIIFSEDPGEDFFREPDSDEETEILSMLSQDEVVDGDEESFLTEGDGAEEASGSKDTGSKDSGSAPSSPSKGSDSKEKDKDKDEDEDEDEGGEPGSISTKHKDVLEKDGFSITVLSEGRFGKLNEAAGYYPSQELIVNVKGVKPFQSFFVAAYLKKTQFDMFDAKSGGRCGSFDRASVMEQENSWLTCRAGGVYRAATSGENWQSHTQLECEPLTQQQPTFPSLSSPQTPERKLDLSTTFSSSGPPRPRVWGLSRLSAPWFPSTWTILIFRKYTACRIHSRRQCPPEGKAQTEGLHPPPE
jgi:hypothetical protein